MAEVIDLSTSPTVSVPTPPLGDDDCIVLDEAAGAPWRRLRDDHSLTRPFRLRPSARPPRVRRVAAAQARARRAGAGG